MPRRHRHVLSAMAFVALLAGCDRAEDDRPVIFAAASLAEALGQAADGFVASGGAAPRFSFDATSRLARQVIQGAPADALFSADVRWMDEVEAAGLLLPDTRHDLLSNRLVMAVRAGAAAPSGPADLRAHPPERIAQAGESVPAGRYADAALRHTGLLPSLQSRVIRGHSVRTVLEWLARGDVPMAVVYASDVQAEPRVRVAFALPPDSHPPITYVAAAIRRAGASPQRVRAAAAFLGWCRAPAARKIFQRAGFILPPPDNATDVAP